MREYRGWLCKRWLGSINGAILNPAITRRVLPRKIISRVSSIRDFSSESIGASEIDGWRVRIPFRSD